MLPHPQIYSTNQPNMRDGHSLTQISKTVNANFIDFFEIDVCSTPVAWMYFNLYTYFLFYLNFWCVCVSYFNLWLVLLLLL